MAELNHQKQGENSYYNWLHKQSDSYDSIIHVDIWHWLITMRDVFINR